LKLKDFQDRFQRAILKGDDAILADIPDGPHETKQKLLGIYRDAYALRLIEVIGKDHEHLQTYMGDEPFRVMAGAYIESCPSEHPNARWVAHRLPEFLKSSRPYSGHPILGDLAALERALNDAFDGPDAPVVGLADLSGLAPEAWARLSFVCHPTARVLSVHTNVDDIWAALKADETPPLCALQGEARSILVWRLGMKSMFRELPPEEAMMWNEAGKAVTFGDLCALLATYADPATAPMRAAGYLRSWLDAGLLSKAAAA
jgi:Putative DNA-binding domain